MFLHIRDLKVYYEVVGSGNPTLLLHGWGTDSRSMRPILESLRGSPSTRVYALDFPGFGLSEFPREPWEVNDFVSLTLGFLDRLHLDRVDIVAHSFGGRVAIKLAAEYPQRIKRLVLVDSAGIRPERNIGYYLKVGFFKAAKAVTKILPESVSNPMRARFLSKMGSADYRSAGEMRQTFVRIVNEDLRHCLPTVKCPTLLVWGELDIQTPLEDAWLMQRMIPDARLEILKGAGHFCYLDSFAAFSELVTAFFGGER